MNDIKKFWNERASTTFAHITLDKWLVDEKHYNKILRQRVLNKVGYKDKVVIDFGIGAGWTGKYLLKNGVSKYIGVDISERSVQSAEENLLKYDNKDLILINDLSDIYGINCDIFICVAVMQHFPTQTYLNSFLYFLNKSNIDTLILQVKYNEQTKFDTEPYKDVTHVANACQTNDYYLAGKLINYDLIDNKIYGEDIKLQYLKYKVKK